MGDWARGFVVGFEGWVGGGAGVGRGGRGVLMERVSGNMFIKQKFDYGRRSDVEKER